MQTLDTQKRGDFFIQYINLADAGGDPITGIEAQLKCQIRNSINELISEAVIKETATPGQYVVYVEDTTSWPEGDLYFDMEMLVHNDDINKDLPTSTETIKIPVEKDVTYDE